MTIKTADHLKLDSSIIKKVTAISFSQPAKRPLKTGLIIDKARKELGYEPITFEEGLKKTFS
jgi:dTDP-4-dehydrorhamnose reductase